MSVGRCVATRVMPSMQALWRPMARGAATLLLTGVIAAGAQAAQLDISAERVAQAGVVAERPTLQLRWPQAATEGELALQVPRLTVEATGTVLRDLQWTCALRWDGGAWQCAGGVKARGYRTGQLALRWQGGVQTTLQRGDARLQLRLPGATGADADLHAEAVPMAWLAPLLAGVWPEARLQGGRLDGAVSIRDDDADALRIDGQFEAAAVALDTDDGRIATEGLHWRSRLGLRIGADRVSAQFDGALRGGELLAMPLYVAWPDTPVALVGTVESSPDGAWHLRGLRIDDPGVLQASGDITLRPGSDTPLHAAALQLALDDLARAQPRYLDALLGTLGRPALQLSGGLSADLVRDGAGWRRWSLRPRDLALVDGDRLQLEGLDGTVAWTAETAPLDGDLRWSRLAASGLALEGGALALRSADGELALARPASVPLLGGTLALSHLRWRQARDAAPMRLEVGLAVQGLPLSRLSDALGWPRFDGTLDARIPDARYSDGVLTLDGDVGARLFDGSAQLQGLRIERPFGVAPSLAADIRLRNLDLEPLTRAFGFGEITGRLDGDILGLRLLDGAPVAFDARLQTVDKPPVPKRVSQRAVRELSDVGGSGLVGGLQAQVLKAFSSFAYSRIGIACRLENNVCSMDGVAPAGQGYVIVEGAGLPRIQVVGFRRRVDWPVLVQRLQAIADGQGPTVE